jgi:hypothetical protein
MPVVPPTFRTATTMATTDASVAAKPMSVVLRTWRGPVAGRWDRTIVSAVSSGSHCIECLGSTGSTDALRGARSNAAGVQSEGSHCSAAVRGGSCRSSLVVGVSSERRSCSGRSRERLRSHAVSTEAATTSAIATRRSSRLRTNEPVGAFFRAAIAVIRSRSRRCLLVGSAARRGPQPFANVASFPQADPLVVRVRR